jgi:glycine/D-amino acid oxidase-like deaminating enzyme
MIDYLIIGQGICGSFVSHYLLKAEKQILVIDTPKPNTASRVASGVINPVTGRRIVKTWLIDELLPFAANAYKEMELELNLSFAHYCSTVSFHASKQMQQAFSNRLIQGMSYLYEGNNIEEWNAYFKADYGIGIIHPCLFIHLNKWLNSWRKTLCEKQILREEAFDWNECKIEEDGISYKNITAKKIICCEGIHALYNPYFYKLPFAKNKGEALIVNIQELPDSFIFKQKINIVPWKEEEHLFWVGSSHEWDYKDVLPSEHFRTNTQQQLQQWLKVPFTVEQHIAAERPANTERRPFVGVHPRYASVAILNGMGTKGCSLAPYFANQLVEHLLHETPIHPEANVKRFAEILSS